MLSCKVEESWGRKCSGKRRGFWRGADNLHNEVKRWNSSGTSQPLPMSIILYYFRYPTALFLLPCSSFSSAPLPFCPHPGCFLTYFPKVCRKDLICINLYWLPLFAYVRLYSPYENEPNNGIQRMYLSVKRYKSPKDWKDMLLFLCYWSSIF